MTSKKILTLGGLFFFSLSPLTTQAAQPEQTKTSVIVPGSSLKATQYTLKNGLRLFVVPDKRNPVAMLNFILDAGSNREHPGATGLAHFFEHNMFRKAINAPEGNYDRILNAVGGHGNAGTSDAFVNFYSTFPSPALESMLKLESDRFQNLDIADPYFTTEKGAVISERKLRVENDPMQRSQEILRSITERGTPMEWMTIGSKADVENMTIASAKEFYKKFYTPDNTILIVGGPFEPSEVKNLVEKYFGSWKGKLAETHKPYPADYFTRDLGKSFVCSAPVMTQMYRIVYPSSQSNLETNVYSTLFQAMLDDNKEGTFNRRLVKNKLATASSFYQAFWQEQSNPYVAIFNLNKQQNFEDVKKFWLKNVNEVLNKPVSDRIKNQVLNQMAVANAEASEKMTNLVMTLLENVYFQNDFNYAGKEENLIQNLNEKKFKDWIRTALNEKGFYITGIVPTGEETPCVSYKPLSSQSK